MKSKVRLTSCCNSESYVFILDTPILKDHVILFEDAGFVVLKHFLKAGILSARKKNLTFTITFGQTKMTARCTGPLCPSLWVELENVIAKAETK